MSLVGLPVSSLIFIKELQAHRRTETLQVSSVTMERNIQGSVHGEDALMSRITVHFKCKIMFFCVINDPKVQHPISFPACFYTITVAHWRNPSQQEDGQLERSQVICVLGVLRLMLTCQHFCSSISNSISIIYFFGTFKWSHRDKHLVGKYI